MQLSRLTRKGVRFKEFFRNGQTSLTLDGDSVEDVVAAAVQVEAMLCTVQKEFVTEEKKDMCLLLDNKVPLKREGTTKTADLSQWQISAFRNQALVILKVQYV